MEMLNIVRKINVRSVICIKRHNSGSSSDSGKDSLKYSASENVYGEEYKSWRTPWVEKDGEFKSQFSLFALKKRPNLQFKRWMNNPQPKKWLELLHKTVIIADQTPMSERQMVLGPDLALAHFIVYRGGKIKFKDEDKWISKYYMDNESISLPGAYVNNLIVEQVDCENMKNGGFIYAGLNNFYELVGLRSISFKGNKHFDDWCLDRFTGITKDTIECIDLRETKITYRGLFALSKLKYLNLLILGEEQMNENMELTCALLENDKPDVLIKIVEKDKELQE